MTDTNKVEIAAGTYYVCRRCGQPYRINNVAVTRATAGVLAIVCHDCAYEYAHGERPDARVRGAWAINLDAFHAVQRGAKRLAVRAAAYERRARAKRLSERADQTCREVPALAAERYETVE